MDIAGNYLKETYDLLHPIIDDIKASDNERKIHFADGISEYIGRYITHISNYHYGCQRAERLNIEKSEIIKELSECENKIITIGEQLKTINSMEEDFIAKNIEKENCCDKKAILDRKLLQKNNEIENNTKPR